MASILLWLFLSNGQSQKVEQYCEVVASNTAFSSKLNVSIDYVEVKSIWKNNRLKNEGESVKKINSVIDALNFWGGVGLNLVNAIPITSGLKMFITMFLGKIFKNQRRINLMITI